MDKINPIFFDKALNPDIDNSTIPKIATISVNGKPFGKQRPRVVSRGGFARAYTPKETVEYENTIRTAYRANYGKYKLEGPIEAYIVAEFPIPVSTSKKKREEILTNNIPHIKKPDCDNIAKCVLDALNGIAYDDDAQICKLNIEKRYSEYPKTKITLQEI